MSRRRAKREFRRRASKPRLRLLRSLRAWMTVAWLGTFAVVAYGLHELEPYVRGINTSEMVLEWVGAPEWLHDANWKHVLPELEARIKLHPQTDPYDDRVCPYVAERLAGSPWIDHVRRVTKQIDGRVKVCADFRKPFALVERNGTAYLVDETGVRLPEQWASDDINRAGWWLIEGVAEPLPQPGERWPGDDLAAGLTLARFLYRAETAGRLPFRDTLRSIAVGNFGGRENPWAGRLQLVTRNPESYIHWGYPPGEEYGTESTAERKLEMLNILHEELGRLPDDTPLDVRDEQGVAKVLPG
ncbi:MAG: hypothetical protein ACE5I3_00455 [Phycisphaerae bacterium]